ncbi:MAG: hypothetical protein M3Y87_20175, partial [Myxococcota bacterium]|nr:hypothetical protein [Myxococcota bacterium]
MDDPGGARMRRVVSALTLDRYEGVQTSVRAHHWVRASRENGQLRSWHIGCDEARSVARSVPVNDFDSSARLSLSLRIALVISIAGALALPVERAHAQDAPDAPAAEDAE